jgi:DNA/RNA-binding domain of Phe-tRNA-synthetase-like protein
VRPAAVDPAVAARFPDYRAIAVLAGGVPNGPSDAASDALLREAERAAADPGHPHLVAWREAFAAAGIKAKRHPCSAAALARRARSPEGLPRISRLVDLYNALSVRHVLPVGGEDRDRLEGVDTLRFATGEEPSDVRGGSGGPEPAAPGEPVWADDAGITCRRWSWRQGERTRLTADTHRALFLLEAMAPFPPEALRAAADDLAAHLRLWWPGAAVEDFSLP